MTQILTGLKGRMPDVMRLISAGQSRQSLHRPPDAPKTKDRITLVLV
ncbi:hypothetical protein [Paenibacillus ottowii]|nr:hypothetical protein [Paenibacillus sp. CMAA1739]